MAAVVADTHAVLWMLLDSPRASHRSAQCFTRCRAVWVFDLHGRHFTRGDHLFGGQEPVADKCVAKAASDTERSGIWSRGYSPRQGHC